MTSLPTKLFLGIGVILLIFGIYLVWERNNPNRLSFQLSRNSKTTAESAEKPSILSVPSANIALPIIPASIADGKWEDTKQGVSYLSNSPVPGHVGNSILYGHNWPTLLGNLSKVKPGDTISVSFTSGDTKKFTVRFVTIVTPDETHILNQTDDKRLTLYTCTGWFDSKRLVVTAVAE